MDGLNILHGRKIESAEINASKDLIRLKTRLGNGDSETVFVSAVGDCCSRSWFEHINFSEALIGETVLGVEDFGSQSENDGKDDDRTIIYRRALKTSRGQCDIEMRNESNGYYSGWLNVANRPLDQYDAEISDEDIGQMSPLRDF